MLDDMARSIVPTEYDEFVLEVERQGGVRTPLSRLDRQQTLDDFGIPRGALLHVLYGSATVSIALRCILKALNCTLMVCVAKNIF